jgi:dipeptidyl aminopeptidase/acylaminoacyl peptidase
VRPASGATDAEPILTSGHDKSPHDWSPDGGFLLYREQDAATGRDLWALPMTGTDRKPIPVAKTAATESNGQFSPDGRFVAYETNESGRFEIAVQTFPSPSGRWQVSVAGGTQPRWRADGKELYFIGGDDSMMAAPVTMTAGSFSSGPPVALFAANVAPGAGADSHQYAVARDGRFLIVRPADSAPAPIILLLNWRPER